MPAPARSVTIVILGREYQISCQLEEEDALRKSARYLDKQMELVKNRGSSLGYEKIAVLAALNIAHELLKLSVAANSHENDQARDFTQLEKKIDAVLLASRQIEI
ncbi:MAG: cell division protein ZapA [Pseudomonadales bacterium]|jgi:cell division protein ZapA|nr:cell division protein ZapA [Pseudomonadales bacterium]